MATIRIEKPHKHDNQLIRKEVNQLAEKLGQDLTAKFHWEGDKLVFSRTGASGFIEIRQDIVVVEIKLNMMLSPLKEKIAKKVNDFLNEQLS